MFKTKVTKYDSINKESLEELGWKFIEKYSEGGKEVFVKDNYYLSRSNDHNLIRIILKDPSLVEEIADPENIRLILRVETIQQFKTLETMILWTNKT